MTEDRGQRSDDRGYKSEAGRATVVTDDDSRGGAIPFIGQTIVFCLWYAD